MADTLQITLAHYNPVWENKAANRKKLELLPVPEGTQLLLLPEMTLTGFSMDTRKLAEPVDGETAAFFAHLALRLHTHVIGGLIIEEAGKYFNGLLHIDPWGTLRAVYKKMHPFSLAMEHIHYAAGNIPVITDIEGWKAGLSICYDLRFPELYRCYARERAELLVNIANWPVPRVAHWQALCKARALENLAFFAGVNRKGKDPKAVYNSKSAVLTPFGDPVPPLHGAYACSTFSINRQAVRQAREKFSFLDDIRITTNLP